jgi:hypothetical protein
MTFHVSAVVRATLRIPSKWFTIFGAFAAKRLFNC